MISWIQNYFILIFIITNILHDKNAKGSFLSKAQVLCQPLYHIISGPLLQIARYSLHLFHHKIALRAYSICSPLSPYLFSDKSKLTIYYLKERHVRIPLVTGGTSREKISDYTEFLINIKLTLLYLHYKQIFY